MEIYFEVHKIINFTTYNTVFFYFRWWCWCNVGEVVVDGANYQEFPLDVHFIPYQTSTEISGIVYEFVQLFPICIHTNFTYNWWEKHKLKVMIRNQKIKGMDGCDSVLVRLFFSWSVSIYSKYIFRHLK